jgi:anti-sigma factor ChrR (cupin superfamily)
MSTSMKGREQEENAALAALGLLSARELAKSPVELVDQMKEAAALLAETVPAVPPAPSIKSKLMERVSNFEALKPLADVRRYDDQWVHSGVPGIDLKTLFKDVKSGRTTMLVRMEPGASLPSHRHGDDEQCLVLKGDVRWGELVYEEGDFVVMANETTHPRIHSVHGNLLLIVAGHNEFVHA